LFASLKKKERGFMNNSDRPPAHYDLHLHTFWSYDATAHIENHFKRARELGVRCIAITEHHALDSLADVLECAKGYPEVKLIPSAELTVTTSIGAVDLLCYGFPLAPTPGLQELLENYHAWQQAAGAARSAALQAIGHPFSDADRLELLATYRPPAAIAVQGNTHVKNQVLRDYCVARGFIASADQYTELMTRAHKEIPMPPYPRVEDVVPVVKRIGVKVAIAHPHGYFKNGDRARMDTLRQECQLDGIECAHRSVPPEFTPIYRAYCVEHGLFSVGGSDSHSDEDIQEFFAGHGGDDEWLDEFLGCLA
jgi:predicted metal-dependent phosphoesterase TrpH